MANKLSVKVKLTPLKYMAYNHNGTPLLKKPASKTAAEAEAVAYRYETGNPAYVEPVGKSGFDYNSGIDSQSY